MIAVTEDEISKAIALNPEDPQVLLLKCQIDYARGNRTEAFHQLSAIKQKFPFHRGINEEFDKWFTYNKSS
ncbi:hypothetical protein [Paenibacillus planticolens]|uniref:hypothetical protein n=1 Tax=Paenibacillus planticolens TaxID=2654976 RepID=UPI001490A078|nr:hypothetical protein [Paenibacillus planticolens]